MMSRRASLAVLGPAALWAVLPISAASARQVSLEQFGVAQLSTGSEGAVTRTSSGGFTLIELKAARPAVTVPALPVDEGTATLTVASTTRDCTVFAVPPRRPTLSKDAAARRQIFWPIVRAAECRHGLPAGLLDALVLAESQYQTAALSWAGAGGLTQLMPATAIALGVSDRFNPAHNVDGGARYLRQMITEFSGSLSLALAAYNAGPATVRRAGGVPRNGETPQYVARVLQYWQAGAGAPNSPVSARRMAQYLGFLTRTGSPASWRIGAGLGED